MRAGLLQAGSTLRELRSQAAIDNLDLHFAQLLARCAGNAPAHVAAAAATVSAATADGHVCLGLDELAARALPGLDAVPAAGWRELLLGSGVVGEAGAFRPLVLDDSGRLYLWRFHDHEQRLARALAERATREADVDEALLAEGLGRLFPEARSREAPDAQQLAAAVAVLKPLAVISGGPGTGKTTTVTRILALLTEQALAADPQRPPRMALAAPTGKAAARMQEAIAAARERLQVAEAVRDALPSRASTLHRLLGVLPGSGRFRHDAANPLSVDAVVVDEASMVDLALMARLLDALPAHARLVLLGDRDQLASVEAGAVLGEVCAGAGVCSEGMARRLKRIGVAPPPLSEKASPLKDSVVLLDRSFRFGSASGIGRLAQAVREGDSGAALDVLQDAALEDVRLLTPGAEPARLLRSEAVSALAPYLAALGRPGAEPKALLDAFSRARLLVAHRHGMAGVSGANALVEQALLADGRVRPRQRWYAGRPIMVTRNDEALRLFNGDIGITLPSPGGLLVHFEGEAGGPTRAVGTGRVPEHQAVWAMTVHKSQGSEFDGVVLALPDEISPVLSRELLYTAITRARRHVTIIGQPEVFAAAVTRALARRSGLSDALARAAHR